MLQSGHAAAPEGGEVMDSRNRAIRALIREMSPWRAEDYIRAFRLPERETVCLIERDVNDLSYAQICDKYGFSPETVKEARRRAYGKISDAIEYEKSRRH